LNCAVIVQVAPAASAPPSGHVVIHGNSLTFESVTLPTATDVVPVFQSVVTTVALEVVPTAVDGNARAFHVIVNVEGVTVVGVDVVVVVDEGEVSVAQAIDARAISSSGMIAGRTVEYIAHQSRAAACDMSMTPVSVL
jgi:hypothetical protein